MRFYWELEGTSRQVLFWIRASNSLDIARLHSRIFSDCETQVGSIRELGEKRVERKRFLGLKILFWDRVTMGWVWVGKEEHSFCRILWWRRYGQGSMERGSSQTGTSLGGWEVTDELVCTHVCDWEEGEKFDDDEADIRELG